MTLDVNALPAFLVAVLIIAASPGPAVALIVQRASTRGFRRAIPTVAGIEVGLFIWALAVGLGLAALIATSEIAFWVLKIAGAGFLAYLGVKALRNGWRLRGRTDEQPLEAPAGMRGHVGAFGEALMIQLANPKAAIFLFAFYPPFMNPSAPMASAVQLGVIQVAVETFLYLGFAWGVSRASGWFTHTKVKRRLEYASGTVFLALATRVSLTSR